MQAPLLLNTKKVPDSFIFYDLTTKDGYSPSTRWQKKTKFNELSVTYVCYYCKHFQVDSIVQSIKLIWQVR